MDKLFVLISQFVNKTNRQVSFEISANGYCPVCDLPPGETLHVKLSRILQCLRESGPDCKIRVRVDDQFTGIEIKPQIVLKCTRILFRYGDRSRSNVLLVEGVPEKFSDFWLRLKYFGFMRNRFWDGRQSFLIERSDSRVAKKLRDLEAHGRHLASFPDKTLLKSSSFHTQSSSPMRKAPNYEDKITRKRDSPLRPKIKTQPNAVLSPVAPEKPRIFPVTPSPAQPSPPPSPPPGRRFGEQYYSVAEDSSDENSSMDTADDSSSDTTDRVSPTRDGGGIGWRREENSGPARGEIGGSDGGVQRSIGREQRTMSQHDPEQYMDSFVYGFLFCVALGLVLFIPK